jgi:hypothetical protein
MGIFDSKQDVPHAAVSIDNTKKTPKTITTSR